MSRGGIYLYCWRVTSFFILTVFFLSSTNGKSSEVIEEFEPTGDDSLFLDYIEALPLDFESGGMFSCPSFGFSSSKNSSKLRLLRESEPKSLSHSSISFSTHLTSVIVSTTVVGPSLNKACSVHLLSMARISAAMSGYLSKTRMTCRHVLCFQD